MLFPLLFASRSFAFLALACSALLATGCAKRSDQRVIKLAHGLDQTHPVHQAMVHFGEQLAEKSGGTLRVDIYSGVGSPGTELEFAL